MSDHPLPRWLAWAADPDQLRRTPFLASSPLFTGLPRRLLARLATRFFEKMYHPGEVVFEEGDPGRLVEFDRTDTIFTQPANERTQAYVTGRFG